MFQQGQIGGGGGTLEQPWVGYTHQDQGNHRGLSPIGHPRPHRTHKGCRIPVPTGEWGSSSRAGVALGALAPSLTDTGATPGHTWVTPGQRPRGPFWGGTQWQSAMTGCSQSLLSTPSNGDGTARPRDCQRPMQGGPRLVPGQRLLPQPDGHPSSRGLPSFLLFLVTGFLSWMNVASPTLRVFKNLRKNTASSWSCRTIPELPPGRAVPCRAGPA